MGTCVVETIAHAPIGIFGGTFDPIHFGHLRLAEELAESLALETVRFMPTGCPPHRKPPHTDAAHRLAMVQRATQNNPRFEVDTREIAQQGISYTVETLHALRQELGSRRPICLLLGADAFLGLPHWHHWEELFDLAHIAVAHRPGFPQVAWQNAMPESLRGVLSSRQSTVTALQHAPAGNLVTLAITALDISATHIRDTLQAGRNPRYLLPDTVLDYIYAHQLYLSPHIENTSKL
ncbi:MAG: nicotinate-nucleotide adenylyltransferase [Betaproteobacteria bacterium]|nr:nicotinate-nucleotide adenylyltransferase [Betaproteobacteria bacterium]